MYYVVEERERPALETLETRNETAFGKTLPMAEARSLLAPRHREPSPNTDRDTRRHKKTTEASNNKRVTHNSITSKKPHP